jgi:hypothetical protein
VILPETGLTCDYPPRENTSHLEAVNWATLGHAFGSAEDVPWLLRQVRSTDPKVREERCTSCSPRSSIRARGTQRPPQPSRSLSSWPPRPTPTTGRGWSTCWLMRRSATRRPSCPMAWSASIGSATPPTGPSPEYAAWALAAYQAVQAAPPALLPLLDEDDDRLRRETAHLLAWSHPLHRPACRACAPGCTANQAGTARSR